MRLVLGTLELTTLAGGHTYLLTVADQLQRMGHEVTIYTEEAGVMAGIAEERALRVATELGELPERCDAVYAQDAPSAYALANHYPEVPQAFCLHSHEHDRWVVPQLPGVTSATVVLHEPAARHARSLAHVPEVVRLRQPVDTRRFSPRGPIAEAPRRALALGNYLSGTRLELLEEACSEAGIELVRRGLQGDNSTAAPEAEINDSDIVVGRARVILEAMSCGRAAYVYDHNGADGWVTAQNYAELEADNFDGQANPEPIDGVGLRAGLLGYRAEMGPMNRDLALAHHSARVHAEALVALFGRLAPRSEPSDSPLDELARLTRVQWQTDAQALGFEHEAKFLRTELARAHRRAADAEREAVEAR